MLDKQSSESATNQITKNNRIDVEWTTLMPKGWGGLGGDANMHSGEHKMLYTLLEDDEHLEGLVGGMFGPDLKGTGGLFNIAKEGSLHKGVGVATDRRVIFVDKGILATEVAEIPYASIETIAYSTGIVMGGLKISGRGTTSLKVEMVSPKGSAKAFADVVRPHLTAHLNPSNNTQARQQAAPLSSAIDDLRKLGELLQMDLITREEFDVKKRELLD